LWAGSSKQYKPVLTTADMPHILRAGLTNCNVFFNVDRLQLQKYDEPVLVTADIHKKRDVVERVCKPIASKPPPKKEAPTPAPQPAAAADAAPESAAAAADGDATPMDAAAAEAAEGEDTPMEQ
jgi:hypothetical protein